MTVVTIEFADERVPGKARPDHIHRAFFDHWSAGIWVSAMRELLSKLNAVLSEETADWICPTCKSRLPLLHKNEARMAPVPRLVAQPRVQEVIRTSGKRLA